MTNNTHSAEQSGKKRSENSGDNSQEAPKKREIPVAPDFSCVVPVILAGGAGVRLRPLSRQRCPKPFLKFFARHSFLQKTLLRLDAFAAPVIVAADSMRPLLIAQMKALDTVEGKISGNAELILEPLGRNTAPAITVAAHWLAHKGRRSGAPLYMLVMPSDHIIKDITPLMDALPAALKAANDGMIVSFGIKPHAAATRYGYIHCGEVLEDMSAQGSSAPHIYKAASFREKPCAALAKQYLAAGDYFWNSGIFLCRTDVFLETVKALSPSLHDDTYSALLSSQRINNSIFPDLTNYKKVGEYCH